MTDKEILTKVIKRVVSNAYELDQGLLNQEYESIEEMCSHYKDGYLLADTVDGCEIYDYSINDILFNPKFAKAFWGEEEGINKVDFIYFWFNADCQKCTIKDFLINHTKEELNLLLDKQKHVFNGITFLGEVTYYKEFEGWQYHQHQMLDEIQEGRNSLLYLEKFL